MNKKELIKNITSDIQDIYFVTNRFENTEKIHPLDIDLALSKVRNLYDLLLKLDSDRTYTSENQREEISTKVQHTDTKPERKKDSLEEKSVEKEDQSVHSDPNEKEPIQEKPVTEEVVKEEPAKEPEFIIESKSIKQEDKEDSIQNEHVNLQEEEQENADNEKDTQPEIIADKFQSKKFIHDNIAKKNAKKDVSTKMQSKPIHDINSAIGLNDKFIFIRELFENDKEQYHETIQILNNFDTFENAVEFLDENFDWDQEDSNYVRLKELVRRKYASK